jgi:hypothetical protein
MISLIVADGRHSMVANNHGCQKLQARPPLALGGAFYAIKSFLLKSCWYLRSIAFFLLVRSGPQVFLQFGGMYNGPGGLCNGTNSKSP